MKTFLKIKNGQIETFDGDFPVKGEVTRVSHIVPDNPLTFELFQLARKFNLHSWTRRWKIRWKLIIDNQIIAYSFNRQRLINLERVIITRRKVK